MILIFGVKYQLILLHLISDLDYELCDQINLLLDIIQEQNEVSYYLHIFHNILLYYHLLNLM